MSELTAQSNIEEIGWIPGETFGKRLAEIRQVMGWNSSEAAEACGLSRVSWQNWEAGAKPRDYEDACKQIAAATGCSLVWLMTGQRVAGADSKIGNFATPPSWVTKRHLTVVN